MNDEVRELLLSAAGLACLFVLTWLGKIDGTQFVYGLGVVIGAHKVANGLAALKSTKTVTTTTEASQ